jgi:hypothetical protein
MRKFALLFALVAASSVKSARAQGDKATAEALFAEGRKLMAAGNYTAACPKFAASQKLDPGVGTMLNLADCYEKSGMTASAWAAFRETTSAARAAGSRDREQVARERADALEKKLARLTITVDAKDARDVQVKRDGIALEAATLGTPVPVDPGKHVVDASAPGKQKWSETVEIRPAAQITVRIPELASGAGAGTGGSVTFDTPPTETGGGGAQRGIAIGLGGLGVVGLVVGTVFGLNASSKWSDAKQECATVPDNCAPGAVELQQDATSAARVSTVGFAVGGVALAAGAVLWLTAPSGSSSRGTTVGFGVDSSQFVVRGGF